MNRDIGNYHEFNKYRLDEELELQVKMYREHAERLVEVQKETELAKTNLEVVTIETETELKEKLSQIERKIRAEPEEYGVELPVREGSIDCAIIVHPEVKAMKREVLKRVQEAKNNLTKAKYVEGIAKVAVNTMDNRKIAIMKAIDLFLADYFARPKVNTEKRNKVEEETRNNVLSPKKRMS